MKVRNIYIAEIFLLLRIINAVLGTTMTVHSHSFCNTLNSETKNIEICSKEEPLSEKNTEVCALDSSEITHAFNESSSLLTIADEQIEDFSTAKGQSVSVMNMFSGHLRLMQKYLNLDLSQKESAVVLPHYESNKVRNGRSRRLGIFPSEEYSESRQSRRISSRRDVMRSALIRGSEKLQNTREESRRRLHDIDVRALSLAPNSQSIDAVRNTLIPVINTMDFYKEIRASKARSTSNRRDRQAVSRRYSQVTLYSGASFNGRRDLSEHVRYENSRRLLVSDVNREERRFGKRYHHSQITFYNHNSAERDTSRIQERRLQYNSVRQKESDSHTSCRRDERITRFGRSMHRNVLERSEAEASKTRLGVTSRIESRMGQSWNLQTRRRVQSLHGDNDNQLDYPISSQGISNLEIYPNTNKNTRESRNDSRRQLESRRSVPAVQQRIREANTGSYNHLLRAEGSRYESSNIRRLINNKISVRGYGMDRRDEQRSSALLPFQGEGHYYKSYLNRQHAESTDGIADSQNSKRDWKTARFQHYSLRESPLVRSMASRNDPGQFDGKESLRTTRLSVITPRFLEVIIAILVMCNFSSENRSKAFQPLSDLLKFFGLRISF